MPGRMAGSRRRRSRDRQLDELRGLATNGRRRSPSGARCSREIRERRRSALLLHELEEPSRLRSPARTRAARLDVERGRLLARARRSGGRGLQRTGAGAADRLDARWRRRPRPPVRRRAVAPELIVWCARRSHARAGAAERPRATRSSARDGAERARRRAERLAARSPTMPARGDRVRVPVQPRAAAVLDRLQRRRRPARQLLLRHPRLGGAARELRGDRAGQESRTSTGSSSAAR